MTVDEILASGIYKDRRGRTWHHSAFLPRWVTSSGFNYFGPVYTFVYEAEMRLLIERDMHRDECKGIGGCIRHPVPHVLVYGPHEFWAFRRTGKFGALCSTHSGAMDAARALAVGE